MVARRVLYMAGSLRYRWIKHPLFNLYFLQYRNTTYAHCMQFFVIKYTCLQYKIMVKKQLETLVYWTWQHEHGVYGYILVALRVLYMAGLLRYRRINHPWFKVLSVQCKNTTYAHYMDISLVKYICFQYNIMVKSSLKLINIERWVYGYILIAHRVLYMAGSLRYHRIKHLWFNAYSVQCKNTPYAHCMHFSSVKYTCLEYNKRVKKQLETLEYWTLSVWLYFGCT